MNRKGDWIQIFLVLFFFLLLVIATMLLFIEKRNLESERPQIGEDFVHQKANTVLINVLREPTEIEIVAGGGPSSIAELIVRNQGREYDEKVEQAIEVAFEGSPYFYELYIWYDGQVPSTWWGELVDEIAGDFQRISNRVGSSPHAMYIDFENLAIVELQLPGQGANIQLRFVFADETTKVNGGPIKGYWESDEYQRVVR